MEWKSRTCNGEKIRREFSVTEGGERLITRERHYHWVEIVVDVEGEVEVEEMLSWWWWIWN